MLRLYNVVLRESPSDSPFVPNLKCDDLLAASSSLSSSIAELNNAISNQKNNETLLELNDENQKFQREQNELNRLENRYLTRLDQDFALRQMQAQQAFNLDMWNKNNAYNSPLQQVQRLRAAGINPAAALVGNGNSSAPVSSVSANGVQSKNYQGVAPQNTFAPTAYTGFHPENAVNAFNQSQLASASAREMQSRAHNIDLGSDLLDKSMVDQVRQWKNLADKGGIEGDLARKSLEFVGATMDYDIKLRYGQTLEQDASLKKMTEELRGMQLNNDVLQIIKAHQDELSRAQIQQIWSSVQQAHANIGLINANAMLTYEQRETQIHETLGKKLDNDLKGINNDVQEKIKNFLIMDSKNRSKMLDYDARQQGVREIRDIVKSLVPNFGFAKMF